MTASLQGGRERLPVSETVVRGVTVGPVGRQEENRGGERTISYLPENLVAPAAVPILGRKFVEGGNQVVGGECRSGSLEDIRAFGHGVKDQSVGRCRGDPSARNPGVKCEGAAAF